MYRIRLATFDVTNTLLKFKIPIGEEYSQISKLYGIQSDAAQLNAAFKRQWKILNQKHPNFGATTGLAPQTWWASLIVRVFHDAGYDYLDQKQLQAISRHLFKAYSTKVCWQMQRGTHSLLENLAKANVQLGIISNFDNRLQSILSDVGLLPHFNFVIDSYSARVKKPSKGIFNLALDHVKHLDILPEQAVHIGNDLHVDYWGAINAGWNALLLTKKANLSPEELKIVNPNDILNDVREAEKHILEPDVVRFRNQF
ncbi:rhythmically expressed gene 2 protein-like [Limulus polyphemus]|uniref:Rhythmically expressed gene 2 protein-like n=1 Tax=Limulus polyphemus TaxID=6850 RepID=A0ABM1BCU5_LIMPO|nr:rhythmically expressed gene 2 protein-like [Limulus polyphemus]